MDQAAILDHQFRVAAYIVTWVIQLGYLAWLGIKWRSQRRDAHPTGEGLLVETPDAERAGGLDRPGKPLAR